MAQQTGKKVVMALALLGAGFFAAWLRFRPYLEHEGRYTDGATVYDTDASEHVRYAVWDTPEPLAGEVNTPAAESAGTLSADGTLFVFAVGSPGLDVDLYAADVIAGRTERARRIASLCSAGDECAPAFDGDALYFASDREGGAGGFDIYRALRVGDGFAEPELLPAPINGPHADVDPAPRTERGELAFASDRGGAGFDLYVARTDDPASPARALDELNTGASEREPAFSSDGRAILWSSERDGGRGRGDLYRSFLREGRWTPAEPVAALCSADDERSPRLSADGFTLFFSRAAAESAPDLLRARTLELYRIPARPIGWIELLTIAALLLLALLAYLAQRWPSLDTIYKCLLVSVLIHLAMLWWTAYIEMRGGRIEAAPRGDGEDRIRVRVLQEASPSLTERSGRTSTERASAVAELAGPTRAALEMAEGAAETPSESLAIAAVDDTAPSAPSRAASPNTIDARSARAASVPFADRDASAAPRRSGSAPALALAADSARDAGRSSDEADGPTRGHVDGGESAGDPSPGEISIARADTDDRAGSGASTREAAHAGGGHALGASVALADRSTGEARPRRSGASAQLALDAPASVTRGEAAGDASGGGPIRGSGASAGGSGGASEPAPGGLTIARSELDGGAGSGARTRSAAEAGGGSALGAGVVLADRDAGDAGPRRAGGAAQLALDAPASVTRGEAAGDVNGGGPTRGSVANAGGDGGASEPTPGGLTITRGDLDADGASTGASARGATQVGHGNAIAANVALTDRDAGGTGPRRSGASAQLALDAPASVTRGEAAGDANGGGPTRGSVANAGGNGGASEPTPGGLTIARGDLDGGGASSGASARGAAETGRGTSTSSSVPLAGPRAAIEGPRRRESAPARDLLADLAPSATPAVAAPPSAPPERYKPAPIAAPERDQPSTTPLVVAATPDAPERDTRPRRSWDQTPYQNRSGEEKLRALELHGGSEETEQAVARGLAYLARIQRPAGNWGDLSIADDKYGEIAVGKTGLCMLAFLGAGHTHRSGTEYSSVVQRAIGVLLASQHDESGHFGDSEAYSHAIATFALTECLALSGDDALRAPLERAVAHILERQSKRKDPRFFGGWGYYYTDDRTYDRWPRTSITVWQVMALESARLSGVQVPGGAFADARAFLENARDDEAGYVRYNHDPERLESGYPTLPASTPAALFALSLLGTDVASDDLDNMRRFILDRVPNGYRYTGDDDFVHRAQGNLYFWYYGTLAAFRIGGEPWKTWNEAMKATLLPAQSPDGSWKPIDVYAKYARDTSADKSYTTAMCVLSLEIYYRYFLPLLRVR